MLTQFQRCGVLVLCLMIPIWIDANEISPEELERWFNSDEFDAPGQSTAHVNDGQLEFLALAPKKIIHHHHNTLTISDTSLKDGWVKLIQCHRNIDQVPAAQILFKPERVKGLKIISSRNIDRTWVDANSVQMENVQANASLCLQAKTRALRRESDGTFVLRNGPFMRRFLDGYYPLRVSMDLDYTNTGLKLVTFTPEEQSGFSITKQKGQLSFDAVFEGQLNTEFRFRQLKL